MSRAAVFLDRDGVINRRIPGDYVRRWNQFEFLPGVLEALQKLARSGYVLVVVTNQRGIQRQLMSEEALLEIHRRMLQVVQSHGGRIDRVYYCPHGDEDRCACRKPRPGMLLQAAEELGLDLRRSWMVGDSISDVLAGRAAGTRTVLIGPDPEISCRLGKNGVPKPDVIVPSLLEAVPIILSSASPS